MIRRLIAKLSIITLLVLGRPDYACLELEHGKNMTQMAEAQETGQAAPEPEASVQPKLEVHYIDVGQGDSILIQTPGNKNILIDCGDNGRGYDVAGYLKMLGVRSIDVLIATHPHADHIGGCDEVMEKIPVGAVYDNGIKNKSKTYSDYIRMAKKTDYHKVKTDSTLDLDSLLGIKLIVTYDTAGIDENPNNNSILVRIAYRDSSFLFTGDCEERCEAEAIATASADLESNVLKVGHHGSATSTTDEFLKYVTPPIAVISVGQGNKYGHPSQKTLDKLSQRGTEVHRTDLEHHITITTNGEWYSTGRY